MAKLFELDHEGDYDVIVLDTPPSRSAVDFLTAPERLDAFLGGRALRLFLRPSGAVLRMTGVVLGALNRIVGAGMLDDLRTFFALLSGLVDGIRERAADIESLLKLPTTGFVVVTSPSELPAQEAEYLAAELDRMGLHRRALVVNRIHPVDPDGPAEDAVAKRLERVLPAALARTVAGVHASLQVLARREAEAIGRLANALPQTEPQLLIDRSTDVHDLPGLAALSAELFGDRSERRGA